MKRICLLNLIFLLFIFAPALTAEEPETKKASTQQVGGLLFDVDEGVKVEQGPGGSVYVRSNREYMQEKFDEMDKKFQDLETRLKTLEEKVGITNSGTNAAAAQSGESKERRVLQS